jgi:hypothetical protein
MTTARGRAVARFREERPREEGAARRRKGGVQQRAAPDMVKARALSRALKSHFYKEMATPLDQALPNVTPCSGCGTLP